MQINLSNLKINYIDYFSKLSLGNFRNPLVRQVGLACLTFIGVGTTLYFTLRKIKRMTPSLEGYWKNRLLAALGNPSASRNMGQWHENEGIEETRRSAYDNYLKAALKGDAAAQFKIAQCLIHGWGTAQNIPQAISYYILSANNGFLDAQRSLAQMYNMGTHVPKNVHEALKYFKLAAAQKTTRDDHYQMGVLYEASGDLIQATQAFKIAADLGCEHAQCEYAILRLNQEDREESLKYFQKAAAQGFGIAYRYLGDVHESDPEKALEYYMKGSKLKCGEATYKIADFYFETDTDKSLKYIRKSAKQGYAKGQCDLAGLLETRKNLEKALKYYKLAAAQGHEEAKQKVQKLSAPRT